jgi:hypothetical protein
VTVNRGSVALAFSWCISLSCTLSSSLLAQAQAQAAPAAPQGYQQLYEQATNELATGNHAAARDLFTQAHELQPNAHTLRGLAIAELELGNGPRAAELLERSLASNVNPLSPALRAQAEQLLTRARAGTSAPPVPAQPAAPPAPVAPRVLEPPPVAAPSPPVAQPLPVERGQSAGAPNELTYESARPAKKPSVAGSLYVSAIVPFQGYAGETQGVGFDGGVWVQLEHFVVEPRVGMRFDAEDDARGYFHLLGELGTYFFGEVGDHALFMGPGVGLHAIFERVDVHHTVGSAIEASTRDTLEDDVVGFGVFGRAGAVLLRTRVASIVPCVDYAITFADFTRGKNEHALRINVGILMGGGR